MAQEFLFVFSYDIAENKPRRRIADLLEAHGTRVQKSVFEVRMTKSRAEMLLNQLSREQDAGDSIRMYCLTEDARAKSAARGGAPIPERAEFWLL